MPKTIGASPTTTAERNIAKIVKSAEYCRGTQEEEAFMSDATVAKKPRETDDVPVPPTLRKSLKNRHIQLIALGGAIGTGLFYGSSESIQLAGPAILLAYLIGGLAIFLAFLLSVLVFADIDRQMQGILLGSIMIVILGVLDDIMALKALPKLFVQIAAAGVAVWHGCTIQFVSNPNVFSEATYLNLGWLSIPVTIIWIVAITNAVNFIDGLDGLAVGVSAISTASLIVVALMVKEVNIAIILCALFGACLGFIPYNMNPAKIFMGDTGSTFLGYILATLSITGLFKMYAIISFAVPFLILGIPIFDISFAFLRRIAHGQNPMKADRGHFHHRLIDMGFSQKQAVAIAYMLTGILGLAAVLLTSSGELKALILIAAIFIVSASTQCCFQISTAPIGISAMPINLISLSRLRIISPRATRWPLACASAVSLLA